MGKYRKEVDLVKILKEERRAWICILELDKEVDLGGVGWKLTVIVKYGMEVGRVKEHFL